MNEFWIARDEDGALWLYDQSPVLIFNLSMYGFRNKNYTYHSMVLDEKLFPEVTFKTGPLKVSLKQVADTYISTLPCVNGDWSCVYHACMSDHCQKQQVLKNGANWGPGNCAKEKG
jgi:hypothetical protein